MTGERESADLKRGREYIELARPRVHVRRCTCDERLSMQAHVGTGGLLHESGCARATSELYAPYRNLTEALFGAYTCTKCPSYGHKTTDHGEQGVPLADRPEA